MICNVKQIENIIYRRKFQHRQENNCVNPGKDLFTKRNFFHHKKSEKTKEREKSKVKIHAVRCTRQETRSGYARQKTSGKDCRKIGSRKSVIVIVFMFGNVRCNIKLSWRFKAKVSMASTKRRSVICMPVSGCK